MLTNDKSVSIIIFGDAGFNCPIKPHHSDAVCKPRMPGNLQTAKLQAK